MQETLVRRTVGWTMDVIFAEHVLIYQVLSERSAKLSQPYV